MTNLVILSYSTVVRHFPQSANRAMLQYREIVPSPDLSHLVMSFWEFTVTTGDSEPVMHEIFPDGCISLFFRRNDELNLKTLLLNNLHTSSVRFPVLNGDVYWAVRISPAACSRVLGYNPQSNLLGTVDETHQFSLLTINLESDLDSCLSLEEAAVIFGRKLKGLRIDPGSVDAKILFAIGYIDKMSGEVKVSDLAKEVELSVRQFERRFRNASGLTPKAYIRIRRLRAVAVDIIEQSSNGWAQRAADKGFSDQAHLTREFSSVTGRSPNSFAKKVNRIRHGNLIS